MRDLFPTATARQLAAAGKGKDLHLLRTPAQDAAAPTPITNAEIQRLTDHANTCHAEALAKNYLPILATHLHLPLQALRDFGVGYEVVNDRSTWSFVERDDMGRIVGVIRRDHFRGHKFSLRGARRGLIYMLQPPTGATIANSPLYLPEGHTDTIALHGAGCIAVGRPAARLSNAVESYLIQFLTACPALWRTRPIIVVGDNDPAGIEGAAATAERVSAALGITVHQMLPPSPFKDVREWIARRSFAAD
jgi:hypothetical protein